MQTSKGKGKIGVNYRVTSLMKVMTSPLTERVEGEVDTVFDVKLWM